MADATDPAPPADGPPRRGPDDRRSGTVGGQTLLRGRPIRRFEAAREILRDENARQAGFAADMIGRFGSISRPPILYLHGKAHQEQRARVARLFAPRVVAARYRPLMEATSDALVGRFARDGGGNLDDLTLEMAVRVAGEIVGLTESDFPGLSRRMMAFFSIRSGPGEGRLSGLRSAALGQWRVLAFFLRDVRPAIRARRGARRADLISHLLDAGYARTEILTECMTYAAAGMVTTREFIAMAAWHLLDRPALGARFLAADEAGRIGLLEEILRLEPVVATLFRRVGTETVEIDVRAANADPDAVGPCPLALDPERRPSSKVGGAALSFGDGAHRCPGADVALLEASVFLDRLLRVPGLRIAEAPRLGWAPLVAGYEVRGLRLAVA